MAFVGRGDVGQTALVQPGWYPDPYSNGLLRWWDGAQWTAHTVPLHGPSSADPRQDLESEQRAARRAAPAVVGIAVIGAANAVVFATVVGQTYRDYLDGVRAYDNGDRVTLPAQPSLGWGWLTGARRAGLTVLFMFWLFRAAKLARNAQLPAKRDPVWAFLGFFVPVVSLWFPYQVARDTLAPNDPRRRIAGLWWTWYLIATIGAGAVGAAAVFSEGVGLVFAVADAAAYLLAAAYARKLIAAVSSRPWRARPAADRPVRSPSCRPVGGRPSGKFSLSRGTAWSVLTDQACAVPRRWPPGRRAGGDVRRDRDVPERSRSRRRARSRTSPRG